MGVAAFCAFAARENVRLRWRARTNRAGTRYRVILDVEVARHVCHGWSDVFPVDRPLGEALDHVAAKYAPFYEELIARQRRAMMRAVTP